MEFAALTRGRPVSRGFGHDPIAMVYPQIVVGAGCQLTPEYAQRARITHVINCAFPEDGSEWFRQKHPYNHVILGAIDSTQVNILTWYPAFEAAMTRFLRDPECKNVYVHCQCGINRSAYLAMAFVIDHFNIPLDTIARSIIMQRPCAITNPVFWTQLSAFAKSRASKYGGADK